MIALATIAYFTIGAFIGGRWLHKYEHIEEPLLYPGPTVPSVDSVLLLFIWFVPLLAWLLFLPVKGGQHVAAWMDAKKAFRQRERLEFRESTPQARIEGPYR